MMPQCSSRCLRQSGHARRVKEPRWSHFAPRTAAVSLVVLGESEDILEHLPVPRHLAHETSAEQLPSSMAYAPHVGGRPR